MFYYRFHREYALLDTNSPSYLYQAQSLGSITPFPNLLSALFSQVQVPLFFQADSIINQMSSFSSSHFFPGLGTFFICTVGSINQQLSPRVLEPIKHLVKSLHRLLPIQMTRPWRYCDNRGQRVSSPSLSRLGYDQCMGNIWEYILLNSYCYWACANRRGN